MIQAAASSTAAFFSILRHPVKFQLFLLKNLPAAYFSGLKIAAANEEECTVTVPYKWFTRNPFRSTYFACLSMAAEMSTGALAMAHLYKRKPRVSMLIVGTEGTFLKKAVGVTRFVCADGSMIKGVIEKAIASGEPQTARARSTGYNDKEEVVAEFYFTWSFKAKG